MCSKTNALGVKKIISLMIIAFIALLSIWSVNGMGSMFDSATLKIDWKKIWEWQQIRSLMEIKNIYYFSVSEKDRSFWFYKIENWKLEKMSEENFYKIEYDYDYKFDWIIDKKYETKHYIKEINYNIDWKITKEESSVCEIYINWVKYWPYVEWNGENECNVVKLSNNSIYYYWVDNLKNNNYDSNMKRVWNIITFKKEVIAKKEEVQIIKPIPKIDKILNKFFIKVDKKWELKANILYKKIIKKIDSIISKSKSSKKKKLLEYIKIKFEEKVK